MKIGKKLNVNFIQLNGNLIEIEHTGLKKVDKSTQCLFPSRIGLINT